MPRKTCFGPNPAPSLLRHLGLLVPIDDTPDTKKLRERFKQMDEEWANRLQQAKKNISRSLPLATDPRWSRRAKEFAEEAHRIGLRLLAGQVFHLNPPITSSEELLSWSLLQVQAVDLIAATDKVHFCKAGKKMLWDKDVLQVFQKLSANPPAPGLTTDTLPVDVSWVKDTEEEEYGYLVYQYLEWGDLPERLTSEYQELVDDTWSAMRSLGGDVDTGIPPQPLNVHDGRTCKNALDQLRNWCVVESVTIENDGPMVPDGFRLHGKTYKGFTNLPFRLLRCLWDDEKAKPKTAVPLGDVIEYVYGAGEDDRDEALHNVTNRLRKQLKKVGCPAEVKKKRGYMMLIIDFKIN